MKYIREYNSFLNEHQIEKRGNGPFDIKFHYERTWTSTDGEISTELTNIYTMFESKEDKKGFLNRMLSVGDLVLLEFNSYMKEPEHLYMLFKIKKGKMAQYHNRYGMYTVNLSTGEKFEKTQELLLGGDSTKVLAANPNEFINALKKQPLWKKLQEAYGSEVTIAPDSFKK